MRAKKKRFTMIPDPPPPAPPIPELCSVAELARRLGCGEGTIRRRVLAGVWESVKVNGSMRFTADAVAAILAERRTAEAKDEADVAE